MIFDTDLVNSKKVLYAASFKAGRAEVFVLPPSSRVASIYIEKQDVYLTDNLETLHSVMKHYGLTGAIYYKLLTNSLVPLVGSQEDALPISIDTTRLRYF